MNAFCVLIAVGVVLSCTKADIAANSSKIEALVLNKCKRYSHEAAAYDAVKEKLADFSDYLKLTFSHLPLRKHEFCDSDKPQLVYSMGVLAKELKQCMPKDERYLPNFLYQSFAEFLNFLCANNGKNIDNFFSSLGKDCMEKLKNQHAGEEVGHCFRKIVAPLNEVVKKRDLCDDITTAKKCFGTALTKHCPDFVAFKSLNHQFFEAIHKPCTTDSAFGISSSLLLIVATLLTTKIIS